MQCSFVCSDLRGCPDVLGWVQPGTQIKPHWRQAEERYAETFETRRLLTLQRKAKRMTRDWEPDNEGRAGGDLVVQSFVTSHRLGNGHSVVQLRADTSRDRLQIRNGIEAAAQIPAAPLAFTLQCD
jgi:hypothetical protein